VTPGTAALTPESAARTPKELDMSKDEEEIRQLVATWMEATKAGEMDKVLPLMTDDMVFLRPGHPPMGKAEFAASAKQQAQPGGPKFDGASEIVEVQVLGDWAFMWTRLSVVAMQPGAAPVKRSGHTLSILRKQDGKWQLARDANMLAPS
jgi:uncharacterized protein (TIGR02246 family)